MSAEGGLASQLDVSFFQKTRRTRSYNVDGKPIPAEDNPRRVFNRLFRGDASSKETRRERLQGRLKLVDAVFESSKALRRKIGKSDGERMDQYLTSLDEIENRLIASERWLDVPIKKQDYSHLDLDAISEGAPDDNYRNMFDLIALAFDADITRSVAFMLSREDGMGVSDTFPIKLGLGATHHNLSHAEDKKGQMAFARYDRFLAEPVAHFLNRLIESRDAGTSLLDNTVVLFGNGASTTHNLTNLPTLVAGGAGMGLKHGTHWRKAGTPMANLYLSILHAMGIEVPAFSDSTGPLGGSVFAGC